jgi:hypothetical protein
MGTRGIFPGGKVRPGRDADHSPPSSAEVENEYELYLLSPQALSWRDTFTFYCPLLGLNGRIEINICKQAYFNSASSSASVFMD